VVRLLRNRYVSAAHEEEHSGEGIHTAACGGPQAGAGRYTLKELWLVESPSWSRGKA